MVKTMNYEYEDFWRSVIQANENLFCQAVMVVVGPDRTGRFVCLHATVKHSAKWMVQAYVHLGKAKSRICNFSTMNKA